MRPSHLVADSKEQLCEYSRVLPDEEEERSTRNVQCKERSCYRPSSGTTTAIIVLLAMNFVLLTVDIVYRLHPANSPASPSNSGSPYFLGNGTLTELPSSRQVTTYSLQNMTGLYTYSATTKKLTRKKNSEIDFFGPPSFTLDQTWELFVRHPLFSLHESEIEPHMHINHKDRWASDHKIHFEPEVFHVLHCLNAVRQQVNRVLYPASMPPTQILEEERAQFKEVTDNWTVLHTEHCLDRIRQDIMCHADMSPSTFYGIDELLIALTLGSPGERVCRDWGSVKAWVDKRGSEDEI